MSLDQLIAKLDQTPELGSRDLYKVLITIRYVLVSCKVLLSCLQDTIVFHHESCLICHFSELNLWMVMLNSWSKKA